MKQLSFWQVDAFSAERYLGNPAAIVFDADELTTDEMQTIARQMNLSETVFMCSPAEGADYHARIFTPGMEIPFAGHPTIASAFAHSARSGGLEPIRETVLRQQCGVGQIPVTVSDHDGPLFTLEASAEPSVTTELDRRQVAAMLGRSPEEIADEPAEVCSIGLPWLIARVDSLEALQGAKPDSGLIERTCRELQAVGLTAYSVGAVLESCSIHVRSFVPGVGIVEDPVCGSGNGAVAVHLSRQLYRDRSEFSYRAEQGLEVHRRGILHLSVRRRDGDEPAVVRLGGQAVKVLEGQLWI